MSYPTPGSVTVFHLTHAQAGLPWIYQVLDALFPHRIVHPKTWNGQCRELPMACRVFRFGWTPVMESKQDAWSMEASA